MKLSEALKEFIKYLKEKDRSKSTITAYSKDISQMGKYFSKEVNIDNVNQIETKDLNKYVEAMKSDKKMDYTLKTVSRKINSMKTFFKYLFSHDLTDKDPAKSVQHPKYEIAPPRVLNKMEYMALRDYARSNTRLYTIVELLLQTGIRIGELARLAIDDLNLESNPPNIQIRAYGNNPKRKVELTLPAENAVKKYLKIRPQPKEGTNSLFVTKNGNSLLVRNMRTSITRALERVGISNATVNDIRNTFIVYQLKNGMPIKTLGETVGHKRLTSTKRYIQLINSKPKRKIKKMKQL